MNKYETGKGIYVGCFNGEDILNGKDNEEVQKIMDETGLNYTNTEIVFKNKKPIGLKIWVCNVDDFKLNM